MNDASCPHRFLNLVAQRLQRSRLRFDPPPASYMRRGANFAEIWFPTGGCTWDFQGYCTMCNFGHPNRVSPAQMVNAVRIALDELSDAMPETLWVSSFNMFDEREVPAETRREIFSLLGGTSVQRVLTESHPNSVHASVVVECIELLNGKNFGIEVGIESMNDFVRRCSINKDFEQDEIHRVVKVCHDSGANIIGNFLIGAPFLSSAEVVDDVCRSIVTAAKLGIDEFVLFPNHVKQHTVVEWLHRHGLYQPPSLLHLVKVLAQIEPNLRKRIDYAWITPKNHPGATTGLAPSTDCPDHEQIVMALKAYDEDQDSTALEWLFDQALLHQPPVDDASEQLLRTLPERVANGYEQIGRVVLGNAWWQEHGESVINWVWAQWDLSNSEESW